MAQVSITQLPNAQALTGSESVPIVQNGVTVQTTTGAISGAGALNYPFLTVGSTSGLTQSRYLTTGTGLSLTDNGAGSTLQVVMTGTANSLNSVGTGIIVKTDGNTVTNRSLAVGSGLTITNPDGISGNPSIALSNLLQNFNSLSGIGLVTINGSTVSQTSINGTTNQISVTNGNANSGNPTIGISSNPVLPGNGGVVLPSGTTVQRTATNGTIRYNTDTSSLESYTNNAWGAIVSGSGVTTFSGGTTGLSPSMPTSGGIILGGILTVPNGGTGASTLTGYVYGNGVSAMTASTTIPTTVLSGTVTNAQLTNSSITINGSSVSLGSSVTVTATASNALTIGTGLSGTSYNGSTPVTIAIANTAVTAGTYGSALAVPQITVNAQGQITSITTNASGATTYQGTWNASTNTPTLASNVGTNGYYYVVSVAGTTSLNGINLWSVGDWAVFNGSVWEKVLGSSSEAFNSITVTGLTGFMYANGTSAVTNATTAQALSLIGVVPIANGGTNSTATPTAGGVGYGTGTAHAYSAAGTSGNALISGGAGAPAFGNLALGTANTNVSGSLTVTNGGTGLSTLATGSLVYGAGTSAFSTLPIGTANQILTVNSGATAPQWSTLSGVAVTTLSFGTTGLTPSTATSGAITVAGTLATANGGTGSASTVSTIASFNNFAPGYTNVPTAGGTTTLTNTATFYQNFSGTNTQTVKLPAENTILAGTAYVIDNDSTGNITVQDSAGNLLATAVPGGAGWIYSTSASAATGNWAGYLLPPGNSSTGLLTWGSAGLNMASSYIQGVTTLNMSGQLTNTVATGTAPFVVSSTTTVANLGATNTVNTAVTAASTGATNYLTFVTATSGNLPQLVNSSITCNAVNGTITGGIAGGAF